MKHAPMRPGHGDHDKGRAMTSYAPPPTSKSRRKGVQLKEVPCPDCPAEIGQPCLTRSGKALNSGHVGRKRMANRLDNERREAEGSLTPADPVRVPGSREDSGGPLCPYCDLRIKIILNRDGQKVLAVHTNTGQQPSHQNDACPGSRVPLRNLPIEEKP